MQCRHPSEAERLADLQRAIRRIESLSPVWTLGKDEIGTNGTYLSIGFEASGGIKGHLINWTTRDRGSSFGASISIYSAASENLFYESGGRTDIAIYRVLLSYICEISAPLREECDRRRKAQEEGRGGVPDGMRVDVIGTSTSQDRPASGFGIRMEAI
jgi:hypothetical protein